MRPQVAKSTRVLSRLGWVVAALALSAWGHSVSLEGSGGGGAFGAGLVGEVELRPFETFLTLGYFYSQLRPIESSNDGESLSLAPSPVQVLSVGVDQALADQWLLSGALTGQLPAQERVPLGPEGTAASRMALSTGRSSVGAVAAVGLDRWLEVLSLDVSFAATSFHLWRVLERPVRADVERSEGLWLLRPGVGVAWEPWRPTRLSLRGAYSAYSADPLTAGGFSDAELAALESRSRLAGAALQRALRRNPQLSARLSLADAASGYAGAPVRWELRAQLAQKLGTQVRADVTYSFLRYVPPLGRAHLLAVRGRWQVSGPFALWATASGQFDFEEASAALALEPLWLGGGGVEWEF